jgi:spore maturation protein CgeB
MSNYLEKIKNILQRNIIIFRLNAVVKSRLYKRDMLKISTYYSKKANDSSYFYSTKDAISEFRHRHSQYCPSFVPCEAGKLRVFWVGACKSQDESGFIQALQRLCIVTIFINCESEYGLWLGKENSKISSTFSEIREANDTALLRQVEESNIRSGIDVLIGQMWAHLISKDVLKKIQSMGIPVINISMDDRLPVHWQSKNKIRLGSVGLAPSTDMVLTTSPETCRWFGVEKTPAIYWHLASSPVFFGSTSESTRDIDVLFIGNKYGVRGEIIAYLEKRNINIRCFGLGWPEGQIDAQTMATMSKRAKIAIGIGTVGHCRDIYTLKLRDFDAPMSGALYLTHRNPDLCELYKEGEEIECYDNFEEAYRKIQFYLDTPVELKRIANNGQKRAVYDYCWEKHLQNTFQKLGLLTC